MVPFSELFFKLLFCMCSLSIFALCSKITTASIYHYHKWTWPRRSRRPIRCSTQVQNFVELQICRLAHRAGRSRETDQSKSKKHSRTHENLRLFHIVAPWGAEEEGKPSNRGKGVVELCDVFIICLVVRNYVNYIACIIYINFQLILERYRPILFSS